MLILSSLSCERIKLWEWDGKIPTSQNEDNDNVMDKAYWMIWNESVQTSIDENIDKYRKANANLNLQELPIGTIVTIEQVTHDFIFGAQIFNFNQLGSYDYNNTYKKLFVSMFNSATIPFYWKKLEPEQGYIRYMEEHNDTEEFWNSCENPTAQQNWRRPATDPIVEFCETHGILMHGHPLVWGNRLGQMPYWIWDTMIPEEKKIMDNLVEEYANSENKNHTDIYTEAYSELTPKQLENMFPAFTLGLNNLYYNRIDEIAKHYVGRINSWDVVNECTTDFSNGKLIKNDQLCKSLYGIMPGDYPYKSFKRASSVFPNDVLLGINDAILDENYLNNIKDLISRGCKIDLIGAQMHLFDASLSTKIANGEDIQTPDQIIKWVDCLRLAGLPIRISEVTIPAPDNNTKSKLIQAVIARNLYRLWFSLEPISGITWWNLVDNCGSLTEPTTSGIFNRDMTPKPAYYALDNLINNEWKTNLIVALDSSKTIKFRGFKGQYIVSWSDGENNIHSIEFNLEKDEDGI